MKGRTMKRIWIDSLDVNLESALRNLKFAILLGAMLFALCFPAEAQLPAGKVPRIGFLTASSASDPLTALRLDAFRQGLRDLGYVEGKNINIEYRYAEGRSERLAELAEELSASRLTSSSQQTPLWPERPRNQT